jgi:hypothetical protein
MPSIDPETQRLAQELRRWKNTALNMMDRYSDLLEAAGVHGHSFFTEDMDDLHEETKKRLKGLIRRRKVEPLRLPLRVQPKDKPRDETA